MTAGWAALLWTADTVGVVTGGGDFGLGYAVAPDERYGLRLSADHVGRLYLRTVDEGQPLWVSLDKGASFKPAPPLPAGQTPVSIYNYKVHPASGVVSALGSRRLWVYSVPEGRWQARELPADIHVRDVSLDAQAGLWCVGSVDSRRLPGEETEAAVRYQPVPGAPFQPRPLRLTPADTARVIGEGGLAELRTINAEAAPPVATSICSWLLDDDSSFVFTTVANRTSVKRLKGEMICHIDRPRAGAVRVFTHQGSVWEGDGAAWKQHSLVAPLIKALTISKRQILIRGLDALGGRIAAAVEVSPPGAGDVAQDPEFTALCVSEDAGASFTVTRRLAFGDGGEIQDVALFS